MWYLKSRVLFSEFSFMTSKIPDLNTVDFSIARSIFSNSDLKHQKSLKCWD